jgi:acyl-CoA thioesterase II
VQTLRNGRGTDTRSISAWQDGAEVYHMIASLKLAEDGQTHQPTAPQVPSPETVIREREERGEITLPLPPTQNNWSKMELVGPTFLEFIPNRDMNIQVWVQVPGADLLNERQRQIVLAYVSDGPLMFNSVLPYGAPMQTHWATTIDHRVWFHPPTDPSQWMLFDQRSTAAADGRGLNKDEIYATDGALVMSCAQESVLRATPAQ